MMSPQARYRLRRVVSSVKPVDWLTLTFLLVTLPLAIAAKVWGGVIIRLVLIPAVIFGRGYLNTGAKPMKLATQAIIFALDMYPLIACIYMYGEDGKTLAYLYPDQEKSFWDNAIKQADANLLGVPVEIGAGAVVRARTSYIFNRIMGEYLHFAYFAFYIILVGTPLLAWVFVPREYFDRVMTSQTTVYVFCCALYLFFPTAGPYWAYPDQRPDADSVGYLFSKITHTLVGGGSSIGTAFPSGHCSITTSAMVMAAVYMPKLFLLYIFIGPALVVATVWGGFHYFYDALFGVLLGLVSAAVGIAFARTLSYTPPACDQKYSAQYRTRAGAGGSGKDWLGLMAGFAGMSADRLVTMGSPRSRAGDSTGKGLFYMNLPEFDEDDVSFGEEEDLEKGKGGYASGAPLAFVPALPRVPSSTRRTITGELGPPA